MIKQDSWLKDILFLTLIISLFYFIWLGHYPLFTPDEGRYSEVAREMIVSGDYITPRVNGVAFLDKPILYYWLQTAGIHLFGLNEFALRFFPALCGIFGCLLGYIAGRQLFTRRTGILAAIILATSPLYFGGAHYADLNLEVATFINAALLFFIMGINQSGKLRFSLLMTAYIFSALAFLTKGMIGIVFPTLIIGLWILFTNQWALIKKMWLITGLVLFALIVTPWYLLAEKANPAFLHFFFVTQQVTRFLSEADFNNKLPIWFYIPVILAGFLPWTIFLTQALINSFKNKITLYLFIWSAVIFIFFSIPHSKLVGYIFPVFMPLALLTANYINTLWDKHKFIPLIFKLFASISAIGLLAIVFYAPQYNKNSIKPLALTLKSIIKPQDEVATYLRYYQDLPIYLETRITMVGEWDAPDNNIKDNWMREFALGRQFQDTKDWLINENMFWQRWHSKERLFVFVHKNNLVTFKSKAVKFYEINKDTNVTVFSNQPG